MKREDLQKIVPGLYQYATAPKEMGGHFVLVDNKKHARLGGSDLGLSSAWVVMHTEGKIEPTGHSTRPAGIKAFGDLRRACDLTLAVEKMPPVVSTQEHEGDGEVEVNPSRRHSHARVNLDGFEVLSDYKGTAPTDENRHGAGALMDMMGSRFGPEWMYQKLCEGANAYTVVIVKENGVYQGILKVPNFGVQKQFLELITNHIVGRPIERQQIITAPKTSDLSELISSAQKSPILAETLVKVLQEIIDKAKPPA